MSAFFDYDETRRYSDGKVVPFDGQFFRVSKDIMVPVSPLTVIAEGGKLRPIFLCGWSKLSLDRLQRRLLCTVVEDAFLSLTDYVDQPADFLFFPCDKEGKRNLELWSRGDYELLSKTEMDDVLERFVRARELARAVLLNAPGDEERSRDGDGTDDSPDQPPLPGID